MSVLVYLTFFTSTPTYLFRKSKEEEEEEAKERDDRDGHDDIITTTSCVSVLFSRFYMKSVTITQSFNCPLTRWIHHSSDVGT